MLVECTGPRAEAVACLRLWWALETQHTKASSSSTNKQKIFSFCYLRYLFSFSATVLFCCCCCYHRNRTQQMSAHLLEATRGKKCIALSIVTLLLLLTTRSLTIPDYDVHTFLYARGGEWCRFKVEGGDGNGKKEMYPFRGH